MQITPRGFTLIELLVTMAILALLASIALPSYSRHVARAHRAEARTVLLNATQFMQRFYAANDRYDMDRRETKRVDELMPPTLQQAPAEAPSTAALYTLTITASNADAYTLTMSPVSGRRMANDSCGSYWVNSVGLRGNTVGGQALSGGAREACWR